MLVKNAASQSGEFVTCIFGLLYLAIDAFARRRWAWAAGLLVAMLAMQVSILFVANGRSALAIIPVLLIILAAKQLGGSAMMIFFVVFA
ncbi:MAG: hypothetical protein WAM62_05725 [Pseudolabrys sp.]